MSSDKRIADRVEAVEAKVDAFKAIEDLALRSTLDNTEFMVVSVGGTEYKVLISTILDNGFVVKTADYTLQTADRGRKIYFNGNNLTLTIPDDLGWSNGKGVEVIAGGTGFSLDTTAVTAELPQNAQDVENSRYQINKIDRVSDTDVYNITQTGTAGGGGGGGDVSSVFGRTGAVGAQSGDYTAAQVTNAFDKTADDTDNITEGATNLFRTTTTDNDNRNRANHTGTQTASTISDFDTEVANNSAVAANTAKVGVTTEEANTIDSVTAGEPSGSDQVVNVVSLTQAEFDAGTKVATTLYIIDG